MKDKKALFSLLACPQCFSALTLKEPENLHCGTCIRDYKIVKGAPVLFTPETESAVESSLKSLEKRRTSAPAWVKKVKAVLDPPSLYCMNVQERIVGEYITPLLEAGKSVLHIGSKRENVGDTAINLDISPYFENVDIVCDAHRLSFRDGSIDAVYIPGVLEHVMDPEKIVSEIHRVLAPGGMVIAGVPFIQGYHPDPLDLRRYTADGVALLFRSFKKVDAGAGGGPGSALAWVLQEYISILLSFNSMYLYRFWQVVAGWLVFWLKYTDILLSSNRFAVNIAGATYFVGKK